MLRIKNKLKIRNLYELNLISIKSFPIIRWIIFNLDMLININAEKSIEDTF